MEIIDVPQLKHNKKSMTKYVKSIRLTAVCHMSESELKRIYYEDIFKKGLAPLLTENVFFYLTHLEFKVHPACLSHAIPCISLDPPPPNFSTFFTLQPQI